ncbi:MAG: hypothetical protein HXX11_09345 [Desulfuromonadales bacterium]|nr:hypothetical protein [Desulfuromonadales bacterium]
MKTAIITVVLTGICTAPTFAADSDTGPKGQGKGIEQKKAEVIHHIEERIANSQAEIICVKSAQTHSELRSCHEKYRPQPKNERRERNPQQQGTEKE